MASATRGLGNPEVAYDVPLGEDDPGYAVDALLQAGDVDGAEAELERLCLEALDSGEPVPMTRESWEELRRELHRRANLVS